MMNAKIEPFVKGTGHILKTASQKLREMGYIQIRVLSDQKGVFCIEYPKFYLTANGYLYHKVIISNQKEIIHRARITHKDLVVYVAETGTFYIFNPQDIIDNHWENLHGYLLMYNWDINIGKVFNQ